MSPLDVAVVAVMVAVFFLWGHREMREAAREREWRLEAEAKADAFEALFLEDAQERL